jgi:hypothetical protein
MKQVRRRAGRNLELRVNRSGMTIACNCFFHPETIIFPSPGQGRDDRSPNKKAPGCEAGHPGAKWRFSHSETV